LTKKKHGKLEKTSNVTEASFTTTDHLKIKVARTFSKATKTLLPVK
jgi:hypothetical protein